MASSLQVSLRDTPHAHSTGSRAGLPMAPGDAPARSRAPPRPPPRSHRAGNGERHQSWARSPTPRLPGADTGDAGTAGAPGPSEPTCAEGQHERPKLPRSLCTLPTDQPGVGHTARRPSLLPAP